VAPHVQRHHRGLAEILRENVRHDEADAVLDSGPHRCLPAFVHEIGVELDAHGPAARLPGGLDDDAPVAGAQVVQDVVFSHAGLCQDLGDHVVGGRQERGVEFHAALGVHVGMGRGYGAKMQNEGR